MKVQMAFFWNEVHAQIWSLVELTSTINISVWAAFTYEVNVVSYINQVAVRSNLVFRETIIAPQSTKYKKIKFSQKYYFFYVLPKLHE